MHLADTQQVKEFMRWICDGTGMSLEALRHMCAFFYGKDIGDALNLEEA